MEIKINLSACTQEQAQAILSFLQSTLYGAAPTGKSLDATVQESFPGAKEVTLQDVRDAMRAYINKHGKDAAQMILAKHGLKRVSDAGPEALAQIYGEVQDDA